jgi:serine protease AprX
LIVKQLSFLFCLAVFAAAAQSATAQSATAQSATAQSLDHGYKLSADLAAADPQAQCNVIVQWKHIPTERDHQKVYSRGGTLRRAFSRMSSAAYSIPASELSGLANDPDVVFITPDRPIRAKLDYTAAAVNASVAWYNNAYGYGIGVALIDSGLNSNADFNKHARIVYNQDFTGEFTQNGNVQDPANAPDLYGHGEHVAGILGGNGTNSLCGSCDRRLVGMAPGVNIVNLRVLDENGNGSDSGVIAAIDTAITLQHTYNIRVMNLSLGRAVYESYKNDPLCQAVEQAWKAGIVVVVAAGNDGRDNSFGTNGYGTISSPGNDPYVITVGAMKSEATYSRTDDLIASYSSKGPTLVDGIVKPDLVAPGNLVVSLLASTTATLALQYPANNTPRSYYTHTGDSKPGNTFFLLSGTSMATPVVSGAAADLLQANPAMTPDQVKARLMLTAYKTFPASSVATDPTTGQSYVSYYDIFTVGAGYLDIAAALTNQSLAQGTALSPTAVYNSSTGGIGIVADPSSVWGSTTVWGVNTVWGNSTVSGSNTVWGNSTVSGSNTVWGNSTVSGSNTVWGNTTVWGVNVNAPTAENMSSGVEVQPSASSTTQSTSLSVLANGEK